MRTLAIKTERNIAFLFFTFIQVFINWEKYYTMLAVRTTKMSYEFHGHTIKITSLSTLSLSVQEFQF